MIKKKLLYPVLASLMMSVGVAHADIKVGVLLPLTGPLASLGNDVNRGFELARDMINEKGGVNGQKVVFASADVPGSTEATSQANRLITRDRVEIIMARMQAQFHSQQVRLPSATVLYTLSKEQSLMTLPNGDLKICSVLSTLQPNLVRPVRSTPQSTSFLV